MSDAPAITGVHHFSVIGVQRCESPLCQGRKDFLVLAGEGVLELQR